MPLVRPQLPAVLIALSLFTFVINHFATAQRKGIDTYAITNERIVPVSGPVIEHGAIVIRNGLIAAVGANITAPADARIIDGSALTVYPGLFDSYTSLGLPEPALSPSPSGGGFFQTVARQPAANPAGAPNSTQPVGLQPEVMVDDLIKPGGADIESSRNVGITTALTVPRTGIWMGQLVSRLLLISTVCALPLNMTRGQKTMEQNPVETLIRNATVLTITQGKLENTDVLIRKSKIAAVGKNLRVSAGARVIDATGKFVMPGIIDCHSHSMLDAINEGTLAVTSMARTRDVLNPTDVDLYRELAGGVTTLNVLHGSANPIGGLNTVVKIKYGRPLADFIFPGAMPGIKLALGENPKRSSSPTLPGVQRRYPNTRMGVEEVIRDAFTRGRDYKKTWEEYRAAVERGDKNLIPPRRDLQLEPLVEVLEGN